MAVSNKLKKKNLTNLTCIGSLTPLTDLVSLYSLSKDNNFVFEENKGLSLSSENIDLAKSYTIGSFFDHLENYDSIFFLGFNPRFEGSSLNSSVIRIKRNYDVNIFSFNDATENYISQNNFGLHYNTLNLLIEGRFNFLSNLRKTSQNKIFYGLGFENLFTSFFSFIYILDKFLFTRSIYLAKNLGQLHFFEVIGNSEKTFFNKKIQKNIDTVWNVNSFNTTKYKKIKKLFNFVTNKVITKSVAKVDSITFPIKAIYEYDTIILPITGSLRQVYKSANALTSFSLFQWKGCAALINLEISVKLKKKVINNLKNFKLDAFTNNFYSLNTVNWRLFFFLITTYFINKDSFVNTYAFLNVHNSFYKKNFIYTGFGNLNVYNFYTTTSFLNFSSTIVSLAYLAEGNLLLK